MSNLRAVIFDLGETLLNYGAVDIDAVFAEGARLTYAYLQELDLGPLPPFDRYHRTHIRRIKLSYLWSNIVQREVSCLAILRQLAGRMGLSLTDEHLQALAWRWYEPLGAQARIEPDLGATLTRLQEQGRALGIISNTFLPAAVLDRHLEQFDLRDRFAVRVYSSDTVYRKPDRRIFARALAGLGVNGSEAAMVGDTVRADIRGGWRQGMTAVYKRGELNRRRRVPRGVPVIDDIRELPALLARLEGG